MPKQELLTVIQAQMVYMIMRIIDGAKQSTEWNEEMMSAEAVSPSFCPRYV